MINNVFVVSNDEQASKETKGHNRIVNDFPVQSNNEDLANCRYKTSDRFHGRLKPV